MKTKIEQCVEEILEWFDSGTDKEVKSDLESILTKHFPQPAPDAKLEEIVDKWHKLHGNGYNFRDSLYNACLEHAATLKDNQ